MSNRRSFGLALLTSLGVHALLLTLTFGGQTQGLPGFGLPWQERRIEVSDLRMVLLPAPVPLEPPAAGGQAPEPVAAAVPPLRSSGDTRVREATPVAAPLPEASPAADADRSDGVAPATLTAPTVIATERVDDPPWLVPAEPAVPTPVVQAAPAASATDRAPPVPQAAPAARPKAIEPDAAEHAAEQARLDRLAAQARRQVAQLEAARAEAARLEAERQDRERQEAARQDAARQAAALQEAARRDAERQDAARVEAARLEAERQELARQVAARQEFAKQEAARLEAARVEAARGESVRQEAARLEAERVDAERLEIARQAAARQDLARQEAARVEAARQEAERQQAARQVVAQQEAARAQAAQALVDAAARREAARRAAGRQLDEEAARRDAVAASAAAAASRPAGTLPYSWSSARRGRLLGRTDPNADLVLYAEAWARKIQFNTSLDTVREALKRPHVQPLVTVAIRHDGSVESVNFLVPSGVPEIDAAIRQIVQGQAPYQAFPPNLAREFDVIEIRRTWHFDTAVRLY